MLALISTETEIGQCQEAFQEAILKLTTNLSDKAKHGYWFQENQLGI